MVRTHLHSTSLIHLHSFHVLGSRLKLKDIRAYAVTAPHLWDQLQVDFEVWAQKSTFILQPTEKGHVCISILDSYSFKK